MKNPIVKECAMIGPAILALLMLSQTYFGFDEVSFRFDDSLYASATYDRQLEGTGARAERNFAQDVTPARRVSEIFGQFTSRGDQARRRVDLMRYDIGERPSALN